MATRRKVAAETPEANQRAAETPETATAPVPVDHVAMVSRRADGTPDQSEGFRVIGADETD